MSWLRYHPTKKQINSNTLPNNKTTLPPFPLSSIYQHNETINCLDYIDKILYINLEHRVDRKDHCLQEIQRIDPTFSKTQRIDAIYQKDNGALGCLLSHIKALQTFIDHPTWKTCLIMEDDFTFVFDSLLTHQSIHYLCKTIPDYDVLLLGTGVTNYNSSPTQWSHIHKVYSSQTSSAYLISKQYASTLLTTFLEAVHLMNTNGYKGEYCQDQYWKQLMPLSNWYALDYRIGYQYGNYSDIEKKICDYGC